jgi:hypothetical protein
MYVYIHVYIKVGPGAAVHMSLLKATTKGTWQTREAAALGMFVNIHTHDMYAVYICVLNFVTDTQMMNGTW